MSEQNNDPTQPAPKAAFSNGDARPSGPPGTSKRVERLPGSKLTLEPGTRISLKFQCSDHKYDALLVGIRLYDYLVVEQRLSQALYQSLQDNPLVIAQHAGSGMVQGFRSAVIARTSKPAPILFLSYPETIERIVLRSDERVQVSVPGMLHGEHGDHEVMVTDLTSSGCRLSTKVDLKSPLRDLHVGERMLVHCHLGPGQEFTAPFILRRIEEKKGLLYLGGQFVDLQPDMTEVLDNFVRMALRLIR